MMEKEILFSNEDRTVVVIDIPCSITTAQESNGSEYLLSCMPISAPHPNIEPKSKKSDERVNNYGTDSALHADYVTFIRHTTAEVLVDFKIKEGFCCARTIATIPLSNRKQGSKRRSSLSTEDHNAPKKPSSYERSTKELQDPISPDGCCSLVSSFLETLMREGEYKATVPTDSIVDTTCLDPSMDLATPEYGDNTLAYYNDSKKHVVFYFKGSTSLPALSFRVPRGSAFLLSDCEKTLAFRSSARRFLSSLNKSRFDFILLDPPWPNRSARRRGSYAIQRDMRSINNLLLGMDLDTQIKPGGYIAMWITNKASVRECALALFELWNIELVEEWLWLKVTKHGEPISPLDGQWRRPYEILLVGRRPSNPMAHAERGLAMIRRRLLVAVPDLHSRKPCLKSMIEAVLLPDTPNYAALEVFARYLVVGWLSWGNEVLKYNADCFWRPSPVE